MRTYKIKFQIEIDESRDLTLYHVIIDGEQSGTIKLNDNNGFEFLGLCVDRCDVTLAASAAAWREFERRGLWSDFEFDFLYQ